MQCMEIWGGNQRVEKYFHRPGLDVWLYSLPHENVASGGDVY
jgi:phosphoserine phosphatase RsbU/P